MKKIRKISYISIIIMLLFTFVTNSSKAKEIDLIPILKADGNGYITYRNQSKQVQMPSEYIQKDTDFRAVWVSPLVHDISAYTSESSFKSQILNIFNVMEYYNMNALIFHMRIYNDALYNSTLNPISSYMDKADFDKWDPIEWVIEEAHKRGIEFHAWLNPYRVSQGTSMTLEDFAKRFPASNIASNHDCLLIGSDGVILNPGEPMVRSFLVDTCMEIIRNYDVDAIHFDDYFYVSGINDSITREKYHKDGSSIESFRRKQVDMFIESLSNEMRNYNLENNRLVQLGISPTGIYQNGIYTNNYIYGNDGSLISPLGSNTAGYSHYSGPLYADTKKWVDNEWIDYIAPQSYWALEHSVASYADVMDWWVAALKNKKVNLYSGMGLYMAIDSKNASWYTNTREAANQVQYASSHPEIKGHIIFSYSQVKSGYDTRSGRYYQNLENIRQEMWKQPSILPEVRNYNKIELPTVNSISISKTEVGYRLDFPLVQDAKFYVIYRSEKALSYASSEVVRVIGNNSKDGINSYIDEVSINKNYYYGIKPLSITNSLGKGKSVSTQSAPNGELLQLDEFYNLVIPEDAFVNTTTQINWVSHTPAFGGKVEYEVYKSKDNINWDLVTTPDNKITTVGHNITQKIKIGSTEEFLYVKIQGKNRVFKSEMIFELNSYYRIGSIKGLTAIGEVNSNNQIDFKWVKMQGENINYKLQYSFDNIKWIDITSLENPLNIGDTTITQTYKLPKGYTNYYYRVLASSSDGRAVSNIIRLESYEKVGEIQVLVNGNDYLGPIYVNENEEVTIIWDNLLVDGSQLQYWSTLSTNLNYWFSYKVHSSLNTLSIKNDYSIQTIYPDFRHYLLFVQVEGMTINGRAYSEVIELRVKMNNLLLDKSLDYIINYQTIYLNKIHIFQ